MKGMMGKSGTRTRMGSNGNETSDHHIHSVN